MKLQYYPDTHQHSLGEDTPGFVKVKPRARMCFLFNLIYCIRCMISSVFTGKKCIFFTFLDRCLKDPSVPFLALCFWGFLSMRLFWQAVSGSRYRFFLCWFYQYCSAQNTKGFLPLNSCHGYCTLAYILHSVLSNSVETSPCRNETKDIYMYSDSLYSQVLRGA